MCRLRVANVVRISGILALRSFPSTLQVLWERCVASSNQQGSFTTYIELGRNADVAATRVQSLTMDEPPTGATRRNAKADGPFHQPVRDSPPPTIGRDTGAPPPKKTRIISSASAVNKSYSKPVHVSRENGVDSAAIPPARRDAGEGSVSSDGPLNAPLADALRKRLLDVREDLARRASLRTTKTVATNAAIDAIVRQLPSSLAQLQELPFRELQGGKKVWGPDRPEPAQLYLYWDPDVTTS